MFEFFGLWALLIIFGAFGLFSGLTIIFHKIIFEGDKDGISWFFSAFMSGVVVIILGTMIAFFIDVILPVLGILQLIGVGVGVLGTVLPFVIVYRQKLLTKAKNMLQSKREKLLED